MSELSFSLDKLQQLTLPIDAKLLHPSRCKYLLQILYETKHYHPRRTYPFYGTMNHNPSEKPANQLRLYEMPGKLQMQASPQD